MSLGCVNVLLRAGGGLIVLAMQNEIFFFLFFCHQNVQNPSASINRPLPKTKYLIFFKLTDHVKHSLHKSCKYKIVITSFLLLLRHIFLD